MFVLRWCRLLCSYTKAIPRNPTQFWQSRGIFSMMFRVNTRIYPYSSFRATWNNEVAEIEEEVTAGCWRELFLLDSSKQAVKIRYRVRGVATSFGELRCHWQGDDDDSFSVSTNYTRFRTGRQIRNMSASCFSSRDILYYCWSPHPLIGWFHYRTACQTYVPRLFHPQWAFDGSVEIIDEVTGFAMARFSLLCTIISSVRNLSVYLCSWAPTFTCIP